MASAQDSYPLTEGQTTYTIPYGVVFATTPKNIIPVVRNYSGSEPELLVPIYADVTDRNETEFYVTLTIAPNSDNYVLEWIAGDSDTLFQAIELRKRLSTQVPVSTSLPQDSTRFMGTDMAPLPTTRAYTWAVIKQAFAKIAGAAPAGPSASGEHLSFFMHEASGYLYVRGAARWWRLPFKTTNWAVPDYAFDQIGGEFTCTAATKNQVINFGVTFPAAPRILWNLENIVDSNFLLLYGIVKAKSTTSFTVALNSAPDTANYKIVWEAKRPAALS